MVLSVLLQHLINKPELALASFTLGTLFANLKDRNPLKIERGKLANYKKNSYRLDV